MYQAGKAQKQKKRGRKRRWLIALIIVLLLCWFSYGYLKNMLKPETTISQSKAVTSTIVANDAKTKHYDEPNFGIDLPINWQMTPRPEGPYQTYNWQVSEKGTDGQQIQIYEDTIPQFLSVNRALTVVGEGDHMTRNGEASDNCTSYTKGVAVNSNNGSAPAKWQGADFLCDTVNQQRNVIGTTSSDGLNTVILRNPKTGQAHKYFFLYTNQDLNPDYTAFYAALASFKMQ